MFTVKRNLPYLNVDAWLRVMRGAQLKTTAALCVELNLGRVCAVHVILIVRNLTRVLVAGQLKAHVRDPGSTL